MISKVGNDSFGRDTLENFQRQGVDCAHVGVSPKATGVAPISVDSAGDNQIIVVMGANDDLSPHDIEANPDICKLLQNAKVVVAQLEIPHQTSLAALRVAKAKPNGPITILNTAPATAALDAEFLEHVDILCPNEPEAELLTGLSPGSDTWHADVANQLHDQLSDSAKHVVLTMGKRGVLWVRGDAHTGETVHTHFPSTPDVAVDTVGAGDAFVGAMAACIAGDADLTLDLAIQKANVAAGKSVTHKGTQTSFASHTDTNGPVDQWALGLKHSD